MSITQKHPILFEAAIGLFLYLPCSAQTYTAVDLSNPAYKSFTAHTASAGAQGGFEVIGQWASYRGRYIYWHNIDHALLWNGTAPSATDITPPNWFTAQVMSATGNLQVGYGTLGKGTATHALVWNGTAQSFRDINPDPAWLSAAYGTDGTAIAGIANSATSLQNYLAAYWPNAAAAPVQLHQCGSVAYATSGGQQVGYVGGSCFFGTNAALWSGSAASFVNLHPANGYTSVAYAIENGYSVGSVTILQYDGTGYVPPHAFTWRGTAASAVDIHPAGYRNSEALAIKNGVIAGYVGIKTGKTTFLQHAAVWNGTNPSVIDLHQFLPAGQYSQSVALGVDEAGNLVGYAIDNSNVQHAIIWKH